MAEEEGRRVMSPRQIRIKTLLELRQKVDDELRVLQQTDRTPPQARRRMQPLECGSEQMYQRHRHFSDTAVGDRRVTCEPCVLAHREHERVRAARARLQDVG